MYNSGKINAELAMQILGGPGKMVMPETPRENDEGKRKHGILTPTKPELKDSETSTPPPKELKKPVESWINIYQNVFLSKKLILYIGSVFIIYNTLLHGFMDHIYLFFPKRFSPCNPTNKLRMKRQRMPYGQSLGGFVKTRPNMVRNPS